MANYIQNNEFTQLLSSYKSSPDRVTYNKIGEYFLLICKGLLMKPNFINYTQDRKNDMISDACYYMIKYSHNFDVNRGNPFAYFTQIAWCAFVQQIKKNIINTERYMSIDFIENIHIFDDFDNFSEFKDLKKVKEIITNVASGLERFCESKSQRKNVEGIE